MSSADVTQQGSGPADAPAFDEAAVRAQFPVLTDEHGSEVVYLDSGASAQKPAAVLDRMATFAAHHYANIHRGVYGLAQDADAAYEGARHRAATFVNADPRATIFTKNVTEALNLVARSWGEENLGPGDQVVLTELEHHANLVPWQVVAQKTGAELVWMPAHTDGTVDLAPLHEALAGGVGGTVDLLAVDREVGGPAPVEVHGADGAQGLHERGLLGQGGALADAWLAAVDGERLRHGRRAAA